MGNYGSARREHPETSHEAARSVSPHALCVRVAEVVRSKGDLGATSEEVADVLEIDLQSVSPRFADCINPNKFDPPLIKLRVDADGKTTKRLGRSKRSRQVWVAHEPTPAGGLLFDEYHPDPS